ncbi:MAG: hypothetical protein H0V97_06830, partial [Actinobacteria bacterium]|nr:hypothetical protein [Actinomycetota bacterium]
MSERMVEPGENLFLISGTTFYLADSRGDAAGAEARGLFAADVRHLSDWRLLIDDRPPEVLTSHSIDPCSVRIFSTHAGSSGGHSSSLSVRRDLRVSGRLSETLAVENLLGTLQHVEVRYLFGSDFADIFEVRASSGVPDVVAGAPVVKKSGGVIGRLSFSEGDFKRATRVEFSARGESRPGGLAFDLDLEPRERWELDIEIIPEAASPSLAGPVAPPTRAPRPKLETSIEGLEKLYRQSVMDLDALTFIPRGDVSEMACAAGFPWFMALFGRDSILTAYQALPFFPRLAKGTLLSLASYQATRLDDYREAQPGKILHELRVGKLASLGRIPHTPYYGSHDATPLFL